MLTLALPLGNTHGWGLCGTYLTRELARRSPVRLITPAFDPATVGDEFEYSFLQGLVIDPAQIDAVRDEIADSAVLQAAVDHTLQPMAPGVRGRRNVLYTFFEHSELTAQSIENSRRFDVVVGGSSWCRDVLQRHGLTNARAIFQGVDASIFNAHENGKRFLEDQFVVFSGGKFEFRKGQDLVIAAFKILHERHDDVMLVNAWFNHWPDSWRTMAASSYIRFVDWAPDHCEAVSELLAANDIDLTRVITLPAKPNIAMARVYRNSDCGLYPNRCEGGTNLALMEYMACGKPAIVSASTGHRDVATDANALLLKDLRPVTVTAGERTVAVWEEPVLEDIVEKLEWAYRNRGALENIGTAAARSMQGFSWEAAAGQFLDLLVKAR
jgi:glycosyltransferase involved in cell wall biosynthesis